MTMLLDENIEKEDKKSSIISDNVSDWIKDITTAQVDYLTEDLLITKKNKDREEEEEEDEVKTYPSISTIKRKPLTYSFVNPYSYSDPYPYSDHGYLTNKDKSKKSLDDSNSKNIKYLIKYLKNKDIKMLLRYLVKSHYISDGSNCYNYNPEETSYSLEQLRSSYGTVIKKDVKSYYDLIKKESVCHITTMQIDDKELKKDLTTLIEDIYNIKSNHKICIILNTNEELLYIVKESLLRKINIDLEVVNNSFDFVELRRTGSTIDLMYLGGNIQEIILTDDNHKRPFRDSPIYKVFEEIKCNEETEDTITEDEMISINGKEYSKNLVEGMIECKIEVLLNNLEIEKLLQKTKEGRIGDGNNDSLQNLELL